MVDAVASGPLWAKTAIFITWDDWGGWYDHVDPPVIETWTDGTAFFPGGRVGCLVISPYARRGYISKLQHTHVSIIKFCEMTFGLPTLNARDAASDGLEDCFDFAAPPNVSPPPRGTTPPVATRRRTNVPKKTTRKKSAPGKRPARPPTMRKKTRRKKKGRDVEN